MTMTANPSFSTEIGHTIAGLSAPRRRGVGPSPEMDLAAHGAQTLTSAGRELMRDDARFRQEFFALARTNR